MKPKTRYIVTVAVLIGWAVFRDIITVYETDLRNFINTALATVEEVPARAQTTTISSSPPQNQTNSSSDYIHRRPSRLRRVVLLGPHDRYNFGDLLFEKVVTKLLLERAGYHEDELLYGGVLSVYMSKHDGRSDIRSMKEIVKLSHKEERPFDIVYLGGQAAGCNHRCAVQMLPTEEQRKRAIEDKVSECGYWVPKSKLVPPNSTGPANYAVLNSVGGNLPRKGSPCYEAYNSTNYKSFRDKEPLFPDSAVMVKHLFGDFIMDINNFPGVRSIVEKTNGKYIAVQHKTNTLNVESLASTLDIVAKETNSTIAFFAAGTVPGHDSFELYHKVSERMTMPSIVFEEESVWSTVAIIAHAKAILGTSLHVRIMNFAFQKPRVTWCSSNKHKRFIDLWDPNASPCTPYPNTLSNLKAVLKSRANHAEVDRAVELYLKNFDGWSGLLINREKFAGNENSSLSVP